MSQPKIFIFIKTPCGRAKFLTLSAKKGFFHKIRLYWFIFFAIIKDLNVINADQIDSSNS